VGARLVGKIMPSMRGGPFIRGGWRTGSQVSLPGTMYRAPTKRRWRRGGIAHVASARRTHGRARAANGGGEPPHSTSAAARDDRGGRLRGEVRELDARADFNVAQAFRPEDFRDVASGADSIRRHGLNRRRGAGAGRPHP
jgi:hypothetical protein